MWYMLVDDRDGFARLLLPTLTAAFDLLFVVVFYRFQMADFETFLANVTVK